jgi:signal transduction histidine kinase
VGEGTGLGMAIVFKIIKEHSGKIDVVTEEGKGCEFIITLNTSIPGKPII